MTTDLRYPVGRLSLVMPATPAARRASIDAIAALPRLLRDAVAGLADPQLDTPYRPEGWTVRQVVHHLADSHMNGYIRLKLALTEGHPTIKPYDQGAWSTLPDAALPLDPSLALIDQLHARWTALYRALAPEQLGRTFFHPEGGTSFTLDEQLQQYAWHSRHHVGHITALRQREGW